MRPLLHPAARGALGASPLAPPTPRPRAGRVCVPGGRSRPRALTAPTWGGVARGRGGAAPPARAARGARPSRSRAAGLRAWLAGRAPRRPWRRARASPWVGACPRLRAARASAMLAGGGARRPRAGCRPAALLRPVGAEAAARGRGLRASPRPGPPIPRRSRGWGARLRGAGRPLGPRLASREAAVGRALMPPLRVVCLREGGRYAEGKAARGPPGVACRAPGPSPPACASPRLREAPAHPVPSRSRPRADPSSESPPALGRVARPALPTSPGRPSSALLPLPLPPRLAGPKARPPRGAPASALPGCRGPAGWGAALGARAVCSDPGLLALKLAGRRAPRRPNRVTDAASALGPKGPAAQD